jgi:isoleucyl-tRNA synthetase
VRVRRDDGDGSLLIWTTTPWTLPSNLAVAVGADIDYVQATKAGDDEPMIVAEALLEATLGKDAEVVARMKGAELVGLRYEPLFPFFSKHKDDDVAFRVIASGHVTTEDGTGLVHMAPAYGEEDFRACRAEGMPVVDPVDDEGRFTQPVSDWLGQHVKEADPLIIRRLKDEGKLLRHATIDHSYPFCWRSGTPLIYKTVPGWFVRASSLRERMVELNKDIHWVPSTVGEKRFGNWLADARDWNVSRSRFWGTPLPVWRCQACGEHTCLGSIAELEERAGVEVDDLHSHKIDHLQFACDSCEGGTAKRIPHVFDCWFESGAMPFAQDHYPFEDRERWEANFPAQFIAEGLDQTRGWFYTLLVLSTALQDKAPFKNCIVNGMVLAEDGSKMSKSKRNYPDPTTVLDLHGADALRAYLINSPVVRAEPLRFSEVGVRDVVRTVLLPFRNAWSFFVQYANADGWSPTDQSPVAEDRPELDRWILSVLQSLIGEVNEQMEGYYLYRVVPPMLGFIDHLTNWYIRRSRRRFWRPADAGDAEGRADKAAAYATLYEVLVQFAKVMAPVLPFISDALYQALVVAPGQLDGGSDAPPSVHLCDYPTPQADLIDSALEADVAQVRATVGLGRALRERHQLKTRQPLATLTVVHHDPAVRAALQGHASLIAEELNVKSVDVTEDDASFCEVSFKANFRALGPRVGKDMKRYAGAIASMTRQDWDRVRAASPGMASLADDLEVGEGEILVSRSPKGDVVVQTEGPLTVALDTELDDALRQEGLARDAIRRLQQLRKDSGLEFTDRISLRLHSSDPALAAALQAHQSYLAEELLATTLTIEAGDGGEALEVDGYPMTAEITKA